MALKKHLSYVQRVQRHRDTLASIKAEQRDIMDAAEIEKRELSDEESTKFNELHQRALDTKLKIEQLEELMEPEKRDVERGLDEQKKEKRAFETAEYAQAFDAYLRYGEDHLTPEQREIFARVKKEQRAVGEGTNVSYDSAKNHIVPTTFINQVEKAIREYGGLLNEIRTITTSTGNSMQIPQFDASGMRGRRRSKGSNAGDADAPLIDSLELKAHDYTSGVIKIDNELLEDAAFDVAGAIAEALPEAILEIYEDECTNGDGNEMPYGVVTAAPSTLEVGPDAFTVDDLIKLEHSVKRKYRKDAKYMMNDNTLAFIRTLKNANGDYIVQKSAREGFDYEILGKPVVINDAMPDMGAGNKSVLFGNYKKYISRRVNGYSVKRITDSLIAENQTGFVMFMRLDGKPNLMKESAIKAIQHAAV